MVTDAFPTKTGAMKWAAFSRKKGYSVTIRQAKTNRIARHGNYHKGEWLVTRTRKKPKK